MTTPFPEGDKWADKGCTNYIEDSDQEDEDLENNDSTMDEDDTQSETQDPFAGYLAVSVVKNGDSPMDEAESADDQTVAENIALTPSSRTSHVTELVAKDNPPDNPKMRVVVRDAAYATYRAVLYYVSPRNYTMPLSGDESSFIPILSYLLLYHQHSHHRTRRLRWYHRPMYLSIRRRHKGQVQPSRNIARLFLLRLLGRNGSRNGAKHILENRCPALPRRFTG
jgi:hypothetical protein